MLAGSTVKPPVSGHSRDQKKWPLKRGVRFWEVKNVVFGSKEHDLGSIRLREVSTYGRCQLAEVRPYFSSCVPDLFYSETSIKRTPSGPFQVSA